MPVPGGTVASVTPRAVLRECARQGVDAMDLMAGLGIPPVALADRDFRVPIGKVLALWREAHRRTGDPHLALHTSEHLAMGAYRLFDYLIFSSATIAQALERACHYYPLLNSAGLHMNSDRCREGVLLEFSGAGIPSEVLRAYTEYVLAAVLLRIRHATRRRLVPARVSFTAPPPADTREHLRLFGNGVRWRQPHNQIVFAAADARLPFALADAGLADALEDHARRILRGDAGPQETMAGVRRVVIEGLHDGGASLQQAARLLHISPRTLQRRLAEHGVSFRKVVDEVRWEQCRGLLADPGVSGADLAESLRFSEPRAFHRAFRRWTGTTLVRYRRRTAN
ncbi:MAG TPA: AraC family transcriptional regulator [Candidatus Acidoferrales bacterium]